MVIGDTSGLPYKSHRTLAGTAQMAHVDADRCTASRQMQ